MQNPLVEDDNSTAETDPHTAMATRQPLDANFSNT
jgi:hypothetical protein